MKDTTLSESPLLNWWNSSKNRGDTLDFILYKHNIPLMNFELGFGHVPRHSLILMGGKVFQLFFSDKNSWHLLASWSHKGLSYLSSVQDICQCSYSSYVKNPLWCFSETLWQVPEFSLSVWPWALLLTAKSICYLLKSEKDVAFEHRGCQCHSCPLQGDPTAPYHYKKDTCLLWLL